MRCFIILSVIFFPSFLHAQININEVPHIDVTGKAEMEVIPDLIYISIYIIEREENRKIITIQEQENNLKEVLKFLDIDLKNFSAADINADLVEKRWKKEEVKTYAKYVLLVSDFEIATKVFEKLDALKVAGVEITKFAHSKITEYRKEVRIKAIKAAKNKADYLLEAIGAKTGLPLEVKENNYHTPNLSSNGVIVVEQTTTNKLSVQFKNIKITSSIFVKFEIKE